MEQKWRWEGDLSSLLSGLTEKFIAWNRDTFGCIFERKRRVRRCMEGVMKALSERHSCRLIKLERWLKRDWTDVLLEEELLWKQKSRVDWLKEGDRNTKFFHTSTLVRRMRNKIVMPQDENGRWVEDGAELKDMAIKFYSKLFKSEPVEGDFITGAFPVLEEDILEELGKELLTEETKRALWEMRSYKAPGPDGYHAIFFKATWNVTRQVLHAFV